MKNPKARCAKPARPVLDSWVADSADPDHLRVKIGDSPVRVRRHDFYFNATEICRIYGTKWGDFRATAQARAAIAAAARHDRLPAHRVLTSPAPGFHPGMIYLKGEAVVETRRGRATGNGRGSADEVWISPDVVTGLMLWHDPATEPTVIFWLNQLWDHWNDRVADGSWARGLSSHREAGRAPVEPPLPASDWDEDLKIRARDALAKLEAARNPAVKPGGVPLSGLPDQPAPTFEAAPRIDRVVSDGGRPAGPSPNPGDKYETVAGYWRSHARPLDPEVVSRIERHLEAECRRTGVRFDHRLDPGRGRATLFPVTVLRPLFENYRLFV